MVDKDTLLNVAEAILDGREVNWESLRRDATTDDVRELIGHLRSLESISRGHRDGGDSPEIDQEADSGSFIDGYRIVRHLDECLVLARYEVVESESGARAALSLVKWDIDARIVLARFAERRRALGALAGPGLGVAYACGVSPEARVYFVEPLMQGPSLVEWALEKGCPLPERVRLAARVASTLGVAHARGFPHGAITPLSVLAPDARGGPRLRGFGIAEIVDLRLLEQRIAARTEREPGFERYLAPECREPGAEPPSTAADVYALGALLEDLMPESDRGLDIAALIDRARSAVPSARFADAAELARALSASEDGAPRV